MLYIFLCGVPPFWAGMYIHPKFMLHIEVLTYYQTARLVSQLRKPINYINLINLTILICLQEVKQKKQNFFRQIPWNQRLMDKVFEF